MAIKKRVEPVVDVVVDQEQSVFLTIVVGNAQIGGSVVKFIDTTQIIKKGEIDNLLIGVGKDLVGKTLQVTTSVLDSNDATNKMVVTTIFQNAQPGSFEYTDQVDNDGDIFQIKTKYLFK